MAIVTRTVVGQYKAINGTPLSGYLEFTPTTTLVQDFIIPFSSKTVTLDSTGSFSIELECTDDITVTPEGWAWFVEEKLLGGKSWYLLVPSSASPLDIRTTYTLGTSPTPVVGVIGVTGPSGVVTQTTAPTNTNLIWDDPNDVEPAGAGLLVLAYGAAVPPTTPANTVILRKA